MPALNRRIKMISFFVCLALLIGGYFVYGKIVARQFGPDDRETPAVAMEDGVDYVVLPGWRIPCPCPLISKVDFGQTDNNFTSHPSAFFMPFFHVFPGQGRRKMPIFKIRLPFFQFWADGFFYIIYPSSIFAFSGRRIMHISNTVCLRG